MAKLQIKSGLDPILMAENNKTIVEHDLYKNYTMSKVLNLLMLEMGYI